MSAIVDGYVHIEKFAVSLNVNDKLKRVEPVILKTVCHNFIKIHFFIDPLGNKTSLLEESRLMFLVTCHVQ